LATRGDNQSSNLSLVQSLRSGISEASELALAKMSPVTYYLTVAMLHTITVLGSIFIQDISTLFDFVNTFGVTFLFFIFPSLFVILT
jgi:hypothetical protein